MTSLANLESFRRRFPERMEQVQGARWGVIDTAGGDGATGGVERPCLVLLPGTLGTGEIFWQQVQALAPKLRVLALTYPAVADVARYADGVARIMTRHGIERAAVLGSSLGGFTAQTLALRHPERVSTLFIGNSLVNPHSAWRRLNPSAEEVQRAPAGPLRDERVGRVAAWPETDPGLRLLKEVMTQQGRERISARHLKARILALLYARDLPPLPIPDERIVIIECADDPIIPAPMRAEVRVRYPGARVHTLPSGGHFPYISRAEQYTAILREHLGV